MANRQFYRFEDLKTGFAVDSSTAFDICHTFTNICKHWVADLQVNKSAQHLPDICPQQLPTNLPRSVSVEPVDVNQPQTDI